MDDTAISWGPELPPDAAAYARERHPGYIVTASRSDAIDGHANVYAQSSASPDLVGADWVGGMIEPRLGTWKRAIDRAVLCCRSRELGARLPPVPPDWFVDIDLAAVGLEGRSLITIISPSGRDWRTPPDTGRLDDHELIALAIVMFHIAQQEEGDHGAA